jgi:hypothetical protein
MNVDEHLKNEHASTATFPAASEIAPPLCEVQCENDEDETIKSLLLLIAPPSADAEHSANLHCETEENEASKLSAPPASEARQRVKLQLETETFEFKVKIAEPDDALQLLNEEAATLIEESVENTIPRNDRWSENEQPKIEAADDVIMNIEIEANEFVNELPRSSTVQLVTTNVSTSDNEMRR